jgi:hypothetical protein
MATVHDLHEHLWTIAITHKDDYEPYGETERTRFDCSSGCKHYHLLEESSDWGICSNPKSHRVGLLTFEHQGCLKYEAVNDRVHSRPGR